MTKSMFTTLLELPLFQGLGTADVTAIVEATRMEFDTVAAGQTLLHEGDACTGLTFVIGGQLTMRTPSADGSWHVDELVDAPAMLGLDVLYGSQRSNRHTYIARRETSVMHVTKSDVSDLTSRYEVFRLNVLNALTTQTVRTTVSLWLPPADTLEGRIIRFMHNHVQRPAGYKCFDISQILLGQYLGEDPRYISAALARLRKLGLVRTDRRMVEIDAFENLLREFALYRSRQGDKYRKVSITK